MPMRLWTDKVASVFVISPVLKQLITSLHLHNGTFSAYLAYRIFLSCLITLKYCTLNSDKLQHICRQLWVVAKWGIAHQNLTAVWCDNCHLFQTVRETPFFATFSIASSVQFICQLVHMTRLRSQSLWVFTVEVDSPALRFISWCNKSRLSWTDDCLRVWCLPVLVVHLLSFAWALIWLST